MSHSNTPPTTTTTSVLLTHIPADVLLHHVASHLDDCSAVSLAVCKQDLYCTLQPALTRRQQIKSQCKEGRTILKKLIHILVKKWNPFNRCIHLSRATANSMENNYPYYLYKFLTEAVNNNSIVTPHFIESVEKASFGFSMSSPQQKTLIAQAIAALKITEKTNFEDPHVLNQVGLAAIRLEKLSPFVFSFFATALIRDPTFVRAKRNMVEYSKRIGRTEVDVDMDYLKRLGEARFLSVTFSQICDTLSAILPSDLICEVDEN